MFTNCYNSGQAQGKSKALGKWVLIIYPFDSALFVCDIKANFAHTAHTVGHFIIFFNIAVPVIVKLWLITLSTFWTFAEMENAMIVFYFLIIEISALLTKCH